MTDGHGLPSPTTPQTLACLDVQVVGELSKIPMASTFSVFLEQSFSFFFFLLFFSQSPLPQRSKNRYRGIDRCIDIENGVSISPETQKEMGTKTAYRYGEKMSLSPGVVGYYFSSWKRLTTGPHLQMQDVVRAKEGFLYIKHSRTLK